MADTNLPLKDYKGFVQYYRFLPASHHTQAGIHSTPLMGETKVGRIYPVHDEMRAGVLSAHDEWAQVTTQEYNAQTKADKKEQADDER